MPHDKSQFELHKPSELCQVIFFENYKKSILAYLTSTQIDLINILFYLIKKEILKNNTVIDNMEGTIICEVELSEIHQMLNNKYAHDSEKLLNYLYELKKIDVMLNTLGKVKDRIDYKLTSIIQTISWSKHKTVLNKKVKIGVDKSVMLSFDRKDYFAKMYLSMQISMTSKYSKLLYELVKDYLGLSILTIEFNMLIALLNVDRVNTKNGQWSWFHQNILTKAVNEINEKSDVSVAYNPIKERPTKNDRLQVTKVTFRIEKQPKQRLIDLGLVQPPIENNKFYIKSKIKLNNLVKNGYRVFDIDKWIDMDIKKNKDRYDAENRIDSWMASTDIASKNHIFESITNTLSDCDDPIVTIENYQIKGIFSKDIFTKNPHETIALMNNVIHTINP